MTDEQFEKRLKALKEQTLRVGASTELKELKDQRKADRMNELEKRLFAEPYVHYASFNKGYNKAIDDFAERLKEMANNSSTKYIRLSEKETIVTYGVEQIVKQLKERESE